MTEKEQAVLIANKVLDRVSADPDDDLAILARNFLRAREALEIIRNLPDDHVYVRARGVADAALKI